MSKLNNITLAIDPGDVLTAYVVINLESLKILDKGKVANENMKALLKTLKYDDLVIEYPKPRGQPMYTQLIDTIFWVGRYVEYVAPRPYFLMDRKDVKMILCGSTRSKDSNIRAAILSIYADIKPRGGGKIYQVGLKQSPGPLFGVSADVWQALGVALAYKAMKAELHDKLVEALG